MMQGRCKETQKVPLKIELKAGDKLIINGAVIENAGPNAKLLVHNESAILREKEILSVAETSTPASRVYFALQCAYMFPQKKDEYLEPYKKFLDEYLKACPSAESIAAGIDMNVRSGKLYKALKETQKLIAHEAGILDELQNVVEDVAEASPPRTALTEEG